MSDQDCLYAIIGVSPDADADALRAAWHRLVVELHPDRNSSAAAAARFREVSAAWAVLSCPDRRLVYDHLGPGALRAEFVEELAQALRAATPPPPRASRRAEPSPGARTPVSTRRMARRTTAPTNRPARSRTDNGRTWWGGSSLDSLFSK